MDNVRAIRLPKESPETIAFLSNLFSERHVFRMLDHRLRTFAGAHRLFTMVEQGDVRVFGAFDGGRLIGCCFGAVAADRISWEAHIAFLRGVDAVAGCLACENAMRHDYSESGIDIRYVVGHIPDVNRAAIRLAGRYGCMDNGISEQTFFDGAAYLPCREMRKELAWER